MKIFDPLGFVTPTKMIGSLLFRCTLQAMKKAEKGRIPWDEVLPESLIPEWLIYLDMLKGLENVKFPRFFVQQILTQIVLLSSLYLRMVVQILMELLLIAGGL